MESIAEAIIKSGLVEVTLPLQVTQLNSQFVSQKKIKKNLAVQIGPFSWDLLGIGPFTCLILKLTTTRPGSLLF